MSRATPPARRAVGGLPPRTSRPAPGVARLIRSNRDDDAKAPAPGDVTTGAPGVIGLVAGTAGPPAAPTEDQTPEATDSQSPEVREAVGATGVPKNLQLVRREARYLVQIRGGDFILSVPSDREVHLSEEAKPTVTLTHPDGAGSALTTAEEVTEAIRTITDQQSVDVFAMTVRTLDVSHDVTPRAHLPVFQVLAMRLPRGRPQT